MSTADIKFFFHREIVKILEQNQDLTGRVWRSETPRWKFGKHILTPCSPEEFVCYWFQEGCLSWNILFKLSPIPGTKLCCYLSRFPQEICGKCRTGNTKRETAALSLNGLRAMGGCDWRPQVRPQHQNWQPSIPQAGNFIYKNIKTDVWIQDHSVAFSILKVLNLGGQGRSTHSSRWNFSRNFALAWLPPAGNGHLRWKTLSEWENWLKLCHLSHKIAQSAETSLFIVIGVLGNPIYFIM